jgi:hypothetical protein
MRRKEYLKNLAVKASAVVLSVFMLSASAAPVAAEEPAQGDQSVRSESVQEKPYTIRFLYDDKVLAEFPASADDTWGPAGSISVRSTFFLNGTDYDIVSGPDGDLNAGSKCLEADVSEEVKGNMDFYYKPHQQSGTEDQKVYQCRTEDGMFLYQFTGTKDQIPERLETGSKVYARSSKKNDSPDTGVVYVYYQLQKDTDTHYTVTVKYIDEAGGEEITTRTFYVNGKDCRFSAADAFSVEKDGDTVNYQAVDPTVILHKVSDTTRAYTIHYRKQAADSTDPYQWYLLLYDSSTNSCIGSDTVTVKPENEEAPAVYDAKKTMSVNGTDYTINKRFDTAYSHKFSDTNRTTYIYYDPKGYENSSDTKSRTIHVQYVNIADGSVIQTQDQTITSDADNTLRFPDSLDADGVHYIRVAGQVASVDYSYYSPKENYTVYYYDQNNTKFQKAVITTENIQEVTVNDGKTTYRVIPGITRTVVTNTDTGVRTVAATNDSTGAAIAPAAAGGTVAEASAEETSGDAQSSGGTAEGNAGTSSSSAASSDETDVSIDGVQADEIQTPESNIKLDKEENGNTIKRTVLVMIGLAALAACVIAAFLLVRRNRAKGGRH